MPAFGKDSANFSDRLENRRQDLGVDDHGHSTAADPGVEAPVTQRPAAPAQRPAGVNRFFRSPAPTGAAPAPAAAPTQRPAPVSSAQRPVSPSTAPAPQARPAAVTPAPAPQSAPSPQRVAPVAAPAPAPVAQTPARPSPAQAPVAQAPVAQAPASQRPAPAASSNRPAFQPSQGTSRALPRGGEEPVNQPQAAAPAAATAATGAAKTVQDLFAGYTAQVRETSRRADGLPLRLERLIDEISDFGSVSPERREEAKQRAINSPDRVKFERDLATYYREKVLPARRTMAVSIEDAQTKNPGKAVFLLLKGRQWTSQVIDPEVPAERDMLLLNGASVEVVSASRTPFREPSAMFARQAVDTTMDVAEEMFSDPNESVPRTPRP